MKILMVCLGNICRSPLADGLLQHKVSDFHLDVEVDSAGTSGYHTGEAPDRRMILTAANRGTPIDHLRARKFVKEDLDRFDLIYVMDKNNLQDVLDLAENKEQRSKVKMILEETFPGEQKEVPDPYFGGLDGFEQVYDLLDAATDKIIENLKQL